MIPYLTASFSTASVNESASIFRTKVITSPPSPQEKQWYRPLLGVT